MYFFKSYIYTVITNKTGIVGFLLLVHDTTPTEYKPMRQAYNAVPTTLDEGTAFKISFLQWSFGITERCGWLGSAAVHVVHLCKLWSTGFGESSFSAQPTKPRLIPNNRDINSLLASAFYYLFLM